MRAAVLLILLVLPATAAAADGESVRFTDVLMWAALLGLAVAGVVTWLRVRAWVSAHLLPALEGFYRTSHPPRLHAWVPGGGSPPSLFGDPWLVAGGIHWVRGVPAEATPKVVAALVEQPGCVVAVYGRLAEVSLDQALAPVSERAQGRVFVCPDEPAELNFASLSVRGSPLVLVLERAPTQELTDAIARWRAIAIVVGTDKPEVPNLVASRRAP